MLLHPESAKRFIDAYSSLLLEVLRQSGKTRGSSVIRDLTFGRSLEQKHPAKLEKALLSLSAEGKIDKGVIAAVRSRRVQQ